jgi:hypothetical protein
MGLCPRRNPCRPRHLRLCLCCLCCFGAVMLLAGWIVAWLLSR